MIKVLVFIRKYWRIITIITLLTAGIASVWILYKDNLVLGAGKEVAEIRLRECKAIETNLADRLDQVTSDLRRVQEQRELLQNDVETSRAEINIIKQERDQLLFDLERRREIPTECTDKLKWLVGEFNKIEENYYEERDNE